MKKTIFLLMLFISTIIQAQTVPKQSRLAITQNVKQNNATRIVVQDSITKELNWVLRSNLYPTIDQVLGAGDATSKSLTVGNVTGNYFYGKAFQFIGSPSIISTTGGGNRFLKFNTTGLSSDMPYYFDFTDVNLQPANFMTGSIFGVEKFRITRDGKMVIADGVANNEAVTVGQLNTAISNIPDVSTPALQQVLEAGNNTTKTLNINLPEQPYTDTPYGALSVSTAGYFDPNSDAQVGIGITASGPSKAIQAYSLDIPGLGLGIDAQGSMLGGSFYSNEGSGSYSYGLHVGVVGNGGTYGGLFTGGSIGIQSTSSDTGVDAHGGNYGIWATSNNLGILANGAYTGIEANGGEYAGVVANGQDLGLVANGTTAIYANGWINGVDATGMTGVNATGSLFGIVANSLQTAIRADAGDVGVEASGDIGIFVTGYNNQAAIFRVPESNTNKIATFLKGVNAQAEITHDGKLKVNQLMLYESNTAPASSTASGVRGEIRITASYIYYCTANNTWVRSALTSW